MYYCYLKSISNTEDSRWFEILRNSISVRFVEMTLDDSNLYIVHRTNFITYREGILWVPTRKKSIRVEF